MLLFAQTSRNMFHLIRQTDELVPKKLDTFQSMCVCSGTVYRKQAGPPAQLLLPVPKERLIQLHPVHPPGPRLDV